MQASGGMDWLIQLAEKMLRKHPDRITFLAPLATFFLTVLVGTGHVVYTLMPIICDIAIKKGIRPERPCGIASIASQIGITCSPIAAAVVAFITISGANGYTISIPQVLMVAPCTQSVTGLGKWAVLATWRTGRAPSGAKVHHCLIEGACIPLGQQLVGKRFEGVFASCGVDGHIDAVVARQYTIDVTVNSSCRNTKCHRSHSSGNIVTDAFQGMNPLDGSRKTALLDNLLRCGVHVAGTAIIA